MTQRHIRLAGYEFALRLRSVATVVVILALSTRAFGGGAPVNDNCTNATVATAGNMPFSTLSATTDGNPAELCETNTQNQIFNDVWFKHLADCTGDLTVSICNIDVEFSLADTKLAVYDGCDDVCPPTAAPLACDDDFCSVAGASQVTIPVVERECYLIRIGGFSASPLDTATGTLSILCTPPPPIMGACCITGSCFGTLTESACTSNGGTSWAQGEQCPGFACPLPPPPNDLCAACTTVLTDTPVNGTTNGAGGSDLSSCGFQDTLDTWHCWTADCTGTATFSLCDPETQPGIALGDSTLAVFDACGGAELGCDDDTCGLLSEISLPVTSGTQYRARVSGHFGTSGNYTLNVSDCFGGPEKGACCFDFLNFENLCDQVTLDDCDVAGGTWFGPGSLCLGDNDGVNGDDLCTFDYFTWLDHNGGDEGGYLPDFDQNNDFDDADADADPSTGVDPFYNGPAAVANSLWWRNDSDPGRGIVAPGVSPADLIQDLAERMATGGQSPSPNQHVAPYSGTFLEDMQAGLRNYIDANGLTGVLASHSLLEPSYTDITGEVLLDRTVTLQIGFHRITRVDEPVAGTFLLDWRRTGGQYVTVAGTNVGDIQIGLSDPDLDAAEDGGEGQVRGVDHDHDNDADPATIVQYRETDYDFVRHNLDKSFASQDAYDAMPAFVQDTGIKQWQLGVALDPLVYAAAQEPFHAEDAGGAFDLTSSSIVDSAFLSVHGYADPAVGQIYAVVEAAVILGRFGDSDGDGLLDYPELASLTDCMNGPGTAPTPTAPTTPQACLAAFDADGDDDVDMLDASLFHNEFSGP